MCVFIIEIYASATHICNTFIAIILIDFNYLYICLFAKRAYQTLICATWFDGQCNTAKTLIVQCIFWNHRISRLIFTIRAWKQDRE